MLQEDIVQARVLVSSSQAPLLKEAKQFIRAEASSGPVVIVAAEKVAADELTWAACDSVLTGIYRHTVSQLALEVSRPALAARGVCAAGALALEAIATAVVYRAAQAGRLKYFAPVVDRPRFAKAALRTMTELRLEGITLAQLARLAGAVADLKVLMDGYEAGLREEALADVAECMRSATEVFSSSDHPYCGAALVLLCPGVLHRTEQELITAFARRSRAVLAVVTEDDEAAQLGKILSCSAEVLSVPQTSTMARVQSRLFTFDVDPRVDYDESFEMFAAPS